MNKFSSLETKKMNNIFIEHYQKTGDDFYNKKIAGAEYRLKSITPEFEAQKFKSLPAVINAFVGNKTAFDLIFTPLIILFISFMGAMFVSAVTLFSFAAFNISGFSFHEVAFSSFLFVIIILFMKIEKTTKTLLYESSLDELETIKTEYSKFNEETLSEMDMAEMKFSDFVLENNFASKELLAELTGYIPINMFNKLIQKSVENNNGEVLLSDLLALIVNINNISTANEITKAFYDKN